MEEEKGLNKKKAKNTDPVKLEKAVPEKPDFVKLEKNLATLGFFTPSSKRARIAKEKTITFTKMVDGRKVETRTTILSLPKYGLPATADQDKYFAFQKIVTEIRQQLGRVENPIGFPSTELLRLMGTKDGGKRYDEITEWLMRMVTTTIVSEGAVYLAGRKTWAKDAFHVFEKVVIFGKEMPDGTIADRNYVWLSEWQLENVNRNHLVSIDYESYRKLKNHIAKALIAILQVGLYASQYSEQGAGELRFEKSYRDLCKLLGITVHRKLSYIIQQLKPSLDELKAHGYISEWRIERTADGADYKIIFYHGKKFYQDAELRKERRDQIERPRVGIPEQTKPKQGSQPALPADLLASLISFGFSRHTAENIIRQYPEAEIRRQLDAYRFRARRTAIENPQGFLLEAIKRRWIVPDAYRDATVGQFTGEVQATPRSEAEDLLHRAYYQYLTSEAEKQVKRMSPEEVAAIKKRLLTKGPHRDYYQRCKEAGNLDAEVRRYLVLERREILEREVTYTQFLAAQNCV